MFGCFIFLYDDSSCTHTHAHLTFDITLTQAHAHTNEERGVTATYFAATTQSKTNDPRLYQNDLTHRAAVKQTMLHDHIPYIFMQISEGKITDNKR